MGPKKTTKIVQNNTATNATNATNNTYQFITRDDLRDYIHDIHNFLRNTGAGYGQTGMKIFCVFYGLKLIKSRLNLLNIDEITKKILDFDELVKFIQDEQNKLKIQDRIKQILQKLFEFKKSNNSDCKNLYRYVFYALPEDLRDDIWIELIQKINQIPVGYEISDNSTSSKVNLSGKVYEYFVGRDKTAISELGAYFTERYITEFGFNKIGVKINSDNTVRTMIDPFGGSGGFTLGYTNHIKELAEQNNINIDWKTQVNSIYHTDMEQNVVNMTGLEIFAITGQFPDSIKNFRRTNSFKDEFIDHNNKYQKFDYVLTNPPYGGDKVIKSGNQIKIEKLLVFIKNKLDEFKEEIKTILINELTNAKMNKIEIEKINEKISKTNNFFTLIDKELKSINSNIIQSIKDQINQLMITYNYQMLQVQLVKLKKQDDEHRIIQSSQQVNYETCSSRIHEFLDKYEITNANDKEACSLAFIADLVSPGGTCVGVLKEGVFFDEKYSDIRKAIVENFNVTHVISIPQDAFENTSTKTSMIIFHNDGNKTSQIEFSEMVFDKEEEDIFHFDEKLGEYKLFKSKDEIKTDENGEWLGIGVWERQLCIGSYDEISQPKIKGDKEKYIYSLNYKNYQAKDEIIFCPDSCELKILKNICDINPDDKYKIPDNVEYIEISDIFNNEIINKTKLNKKDIPKGTKRHPIINDIIICSVRPNIKKIVQINNNNYFENMVISGAIFIIRPQNNLIGNYIYNYLIKTMDTFLKKMGNGSNYPRISPEVIQNYQIPIPKDILKTNIIDNSELNENIVIEQETKLKKKSTKKLNKKSTKKLNIV